MTANPDQFGEVIYAYTRAQAIDDGVLVDLSELAPDVCREHYKYPIACTSAVWSIVDKAISNPKWMNDLNGVVHDMLWMSRVHSRAIDQSTRMFQVIIRGAGRKSKYQFKMMCHPGDNAEPVMTIMLPDED